MMEVWRMSLRLSHKIFFAFLLTFFLILLLMIGSMEFFAYRNFSDYVVKMELKSLDKLINSLKEEYAGPPGWDRLRDDPGHWGNLLESSLNGNENFRPPPPHDFDRHRPPPPGGPAHRLPPGKEKRRQPPPGPGRPSIFPRLSLFDHNKEPLAGRDFSVEALMLREIKVDDKIIGWVGLRPREPLSHPLDVDYLQQQSQAFYFLAGGALILAAVVSFFLSRHFLAPIKALTSGTQALASLAFDTRIDVRSKDELGQLASDFNVMARTLEKYEQMRGQWISDISHELRTPLSIMRGEIEAIQDGVRELNHSAIDSLHTETLALSKIVNDLHDLSLAESDALILKKVPVDPVRILKETLKLFEFRFTQERIGVSDKLDSSQTVQLPGDRERLVQLFSNLLENSLKYTDKPGSLTIWQEYQPDWFVLYLEDSGPGVPERSLGRLFDRLYRVDPSRNRLKGGSGLGLAICRNIVEIHGGRIMARNSEAGGLRIEIKLPLGPQ